MITQMIGIIAVIAFIISYQLHSNRALFLFQLIGSALFSLQFLLLGAASGCLSLLLNILRSAMLMKYREWKWVRWKGWPAIYCAAFACILFFTWAGPVSILAFTASAVSTVLYWTDNAQKIRAANLFCASPYWLLYDIYVGTIGGIVNESITLVSIIVSIARYGWKNLGDPESGF